MIKNSKTKVTWDSATEVEAYVGRLQAAVKALSSTNRYFRTQHQAVADLVAKLFTTDLLRQQSKWKAILGEVCGAQCCSRRTFVNTLLPHRSAQ